ncbi:AAA family ATPase, partial [Kineococcus indalonis]|uniref:AAA family ATPase n=1 Tax=Kineococcus indalonis TaxID=2696566 RepID=UPI00389942B5
MVLARGLAVATSLHCAPRGPRAVDGSVRRIQFTPDLLPSDVTGSSVWNQEHR